VTLELFAPTERDESLTGAGIFCTICQAKPCLQAMQDGRAAPAFGVDALVPQGGPLGLGKMVNIW